MSKPIPVTIVRPYYRPAERFGRFLASVLAVAVRTWGLMLLAPAAFNINPSFAQAAAAIVAFSFFFGAKDLSFDWARLAKKEDI